MNTPIVNGTNGNPPHPGASLTHLNTTPKLLVHSVAPPMVPLTLNTNSSKDYFSAFRDLMDKEHTTDEEMMVFAGRCQHYLCHNMLTKDKFIKTLQGFHNSLSSNNRRDNSVIARNGAQLMYCITQLDFNYYQRLINFVKSELREARDEKQYLLDNPVHNNNGNSESSVSLLNNNMGLPQGPSYQTKLHLAESRVEKAKNILNLFAATLPAKENYSKELMKALNYDITEIAFSDNNFWRIFFSNHCFEDARYLCENIFSGNFETTESIFPCFNALMRYTFLSDWTVHEKDQFTEAFLIKLLPSLSLEEIDSTISLTSQQSTVFIISELVALLRKSGENAILFLWCSNLLARQDFDNAQNILSYFLQKNPTEFQHKKYDLLKVGCNLFFDDRLLQNHTSLEKLEKICIDILRTHQNEEALKHHASKLFQSFLLSPSNNLSLALIAAVKQNVPSDHQAFLNESMDYASNRALIDIILKKERRPVFDKLIARDTAGQPLYPRFFHKMRNIIPIQRELCRHYEKLLLNNPQAAQLLRDSVYHMGLKALEEVLQGPMLMPERVIYHLFADYQKHARGKHPIKPLLVSLSQEQENSASHSSYQPASTFDMHCAVIARQCLTKLDVKEINKLGTSFQKSIVRGTRDNKKKLLMSNGSEVLRIFQQWVLASGTHPRIDQELSCSLSRVLTFSPNLFRNHHAPELRKSKRLLDREDCKKNKITRTNA